MKNNQKILDEFGKKLIDNYADDINYHNEITNVKEVLESNRMIKKLINNVKEFEILNNQIYIGNDTFLIIYDFHLKILKNEEIGVFFKKNLIIIYYYNQKVMKKEKMFM